MMLWEIPLKYCNTKIFSLYSLTLKQFKTPIFNKLLLNHPVSLCLSKIINSMILMHFHDLPYNLLVKG